jgi:DNA-binding NarL/FixJ family response regulator
MKIDGNAYSGNKRRGVFLVDQFPISRLAVSEWLQQTPDLSLCGESGTEEAAFTALRHAQPDVVVTEVLHQQDLGFIRALHKRFPKMPILVFSFRDEEWYAPRALQAGADGYLMKGVSPATLVDGIRAILEGRIVLSLQMRAQLLLKCSRRGRLTSVGRRPRSCRLTNDGRS